MIRSLTMRWWLVPALFLAGCGAPQPADNTAEATEGIETANTAWMDAFAAGDAAGVAALYTEDAQLLPPNEAIVRGRAAIQNYFQGMMGDGVAVRLEALEVAGHGETAHEVGRATVSGADGTVLDESKYVVIWRQVGAGWQLHRDIWNSNRSLPVLAPVSPEADTTDVAMPDAAMPLGAAEE